MSQSKSMVASGFTLALLVLSGVATGSYLSLQKLIQQRQGVEHSFEVLEALDQVYNGSTMLASGRYGYVISGKKTYLNDYKSGLQATEQGLQAVRRLTIDSPDQRHRLTQLEPLITKRIDLAQQSIALLQQGQSNGARQIELTEQGLLTAQQLRRILTAMKAEEHRLLEARKAATDDSVQQTILVYGAGYLLGFGLLMGVFWMLYREIRIRQQAEAVLQEHSEEVSDLYNYAPCGYHSLDEAGTFIRINNTELDWLGYTRDEIVHKRRFMELLTPESKLIFQENFPRFKEQGWIKDVEFELVCKDGTLLPISLSATGIRDAGGNFLMSRSTMFDISDRRRAQASLQQANEQLEARVQERTAALSQVNALLHSELLDRKQAEQALLKSERQLRTITNALPVLISYVDVDRRYRFNNQAYEQWFDCPWTDIQGQHLSQVLGELAYQRIEPYIERVLSGQTVTYESVLPYKDGGLRWVNATYLPDIGSQGQVRGYFALVADITDRKQGEEALRQSEERLYWVLQNMPVMLDAFDANWNIIIWNRECERVTGYSAEEIVGNPQCMALLYPDEDYRQQMHAAWVNRGNDYRNWEWEIVCKDGQSKTVSWSNISEQFPIPGWATWGIGVDVTDRKQAEAALRESEQRLSLAIEGSGMATWDIDMLTNKALWSVQHFLLLGYEPVPSGAATLAMWQRCVHPDDRAQVMQAAAQAIQTRSLYRSEHRIQRVDNGQTIWLAAFGRVLYHESGQPVRFIGIILDISDRKEAEQALQHLNDALEAKVQERTLALKQVNEDLVRSNQELEQFAYVASHDLQEPLRAVTGYTQLLVQDYQAHFDASAQQYAAYIVDGASRMQQLIQDLLHYSRIGTRDLTLGPTDCNAVLDQVLNNLQVAIAERHATITADPLPTVRADKLQLTQLFQNLIGNAIKFCRDESPQVYISVRRSGGAEEAGGGAGEAGEAGEAGKAGEAGEQQGKAIHPSPLTPHPSPPYLFSVRDNGIGIKPRYLERIFEIFKRLHTRTEFPGTGIGLAICKKIVDRHEGQIWAESQPGNGTTFHFTIPHYDYSDDELDRDLAD